MSIDTNNIFANLSTEKILFSVLGSTLSNLPRVLSLPLVVVETVIVDVGAEINSIARVVYHTAMAALYVLATTLTAGLWESTLNNGAYHTICALTYTLSMVVTPIAVTGVGLFTLFAGAIDPERVGDRLREIGNRA
jgi:hypothetical protein